jgi:Cdc6-like AAA superfamily ATPase
MIGIEFRDIFVVSPLSEKEFKNKKETNIKNANDLFKAFPMVSNYKIYSTRAHQGVYEIILSQTLNLSSRKYVNCQGVSSSTMVGTKGIGKTTSLKSFAHICKDIVPGVHVMYVSFNNMRANSLLTNSSLTSIVIEKLNGLDEVNIEIPPNCESLNELLVGYLQAKEMKLMLLIDELDQLYKVKEDVCLKTLHDLAYIGNQPT